jgi:molybdopterin-containing oxidoreductase family iron-sulfur binding subunit
MRDARPTREGRAVKVEGNPSHPVNRGRLCARGQASFRGSTTPIGFGSRCSEATRPIPIHFWEEAERLLVERLADVSAGRKAEGIACVSLFWVAASTTDRDLAGRPGVKRRPHLRGFRLRASEGDNWIAFGRAVIPSYDIEAPSCSSPSGRLPRDLDLRWRTARPRHCAPTGTAGWNVYLCRARLSLTAANADEWVRIKLGTELFLAFGLIHVILKERLAPSIPQKEVQQLKALVMARPGGGGCCTEVPAGKVFRWPGCSPGEAGPAIGAVSPPLPAAPGTLVAVNLLNYVTGNGEDRPLRPHCQPG